MANKQMKRCSRSLVRRQTQIKTHSDSMVMYPLEWLSLKDNIKYVEDKEK